MEAEEIPSKNLTFEYKGSMYQITFPTTGQFIEIQNRKSLLAPNYSNLLINGSEGNYAEQLVDMSSHMIILCPELVKTLGTSITELPFEESLELVKVYSSTIRPWYNTVMNFIFKSSK